MACVREGYGHTRLDFVHMYHPVEDLKFLDTLVHIEVHVVTLHEYDTIITGLIVSVWQIMLLLM